MKAKTITLVGSISKISQVPASAREFVDHDSTVVTLNTKVTDNTTGKELEKEVEIWFYDAMVEEFNLLPILFVDNLVSILVEERIAFVTDYTDEDGTTHFHGERNNDDFGKISYSPLNASHLTEDKIVERFNPLLAIAMCDRYATKRKDRVTELQSLGKFGRVFTPKPLVALSKDNVSVEELTMSIERQQRKLKLAVGEDKNRITNNILSLQGRLEQLKGTATVNSPVADQPSDSETDAVADQLAILQARLAKATTAQAKAKIAAEIASLQPAE